MPDLSQLDEPLRKTDSRHGRASRAAHAVATAYELVNGTHKGAIITATLEKVHGQ
jgi:hypothetical protein